VQKKRPKPLEPDRAIHNIELQGRGGKLRLVLRLCLHRRYFRTYRDKEKQGDTSNHKRKPISRTCNDKSQTCGCPSFCPGRPSASTGWATECERPSAQLRGWRERGAQTDRRNEQATCYRAFISRETLQNTYKLYKPLETLIQTPSKTYTNYTNTYI